MTFFSVVVVFTRKSDVKTLNKIRTIKKQSKKIISLGSIVSGLIFVCGSWNTASLLYGQTLEATSSNSQCQNLVCLSFLVY